MYIGNTIEYDMKASQKNEYIKMYKGTHKIENSQGKVYGDKTDETLVPKSTEGGKT